MACTFLTNDRVAQSVTDTATNLDNNLADVDTFMSQTLAVSSLMSSIVSLPGDTGWCLEEGQKQSASWDAWRPSITASGLLLAEIL